MEKRSTSIQLVWMGAYFVVVILMCLVFFVGTIMVTRTVAENARQVNEDNAVFMQNSLDDNWRRVFEYSIQILNHSIAKQLESSDWPEGYQNAKAYELSAEFKKYRQSNKMVEDLYLYYPEGDYMIGGKGVYPSHTYWAALYGVTKEYSDTTWINKLFGNREMGYFTVQNGNKLDLYYRMASFDLTGRILVAKINTQELRQTLSWICNDNENSFLAMVDADGYIYAWSGNYEKFANSQTNQLLPVDEDQYLCTRLDSNIASLRYVTITERSLAYHQSNNVMYLALIFLLAAFVSGVGISVLLVRQTSRPVQQLAQKLKRSEKLRGNELAIISDEVDALLQENKQALERLSWQQNLMSGRNFLNECLKFSQTEGRDVETIAAIFGISLENQHNLLIVRERSGADDSAGVLTMLEALVESDDLVCWTQRQDLDVIFLNFDHDQTRSQLLEALGSISSSQSRIVTSQITESPEEIRASWLDCLQQLHRKEVVLLPHSAEPKKEFEELKTKTILSSFQKHLADEDFTNARQLVPELCQKYLRGAEALERTCCRYAVVQQLLHLQGDARDLRRQLTALAQEEDTQRFEQLLTELLTQCSRRKLLYQQSDNDIAGKARCIADELYADPSLSLRMISDEIGISQSYVSRMFKKKYGIGIAQYINQVRIDRAKQLIQEGSSNIKAISMQVGFASDVQFIRVFKKQEGITPGSFRSSGDDRQ